MEQVILNDKRYGFVKDFKHDPNLRRSYNQLTEATFGFSFEPWYRQGLWGDHYIPYSLIDNDRVIANVAVNQIEFDIEKERKVGLQIGTVMTDEKYRHQGLNKFIMNQVMNEWKDRVDFIYLFANDSVLDFYPKFNFELVQEYQASKVITTHSATTAWKRLDMEASADVAFLIRRIKESIPVAKISMRDNAPLIMFYCNSYKKNGVFYNEDLDTIAIANFEGDIMYLDDIFSSRPIEINEVILSLSNKSIQRLILGFTPLDDSGYEKQLLKNTDTLFVLKEQSEFLTNKRWMFPVLSHA